MTILGSGTIISLLTDHGLIDGYQFMVDPLALPEGIPVFHGVKQKINLQLINSKVFNNGTVLLEYVPMKENA